MFRRDLIRNFTKGCILLAFPFELSSLLDRPVQGNSLNVPIRFTVYEAVTKQWDGLNQINDITQRQVSCWGPGRRSAAHPPFNAAVSAMRSIVRPSPGEVL